MTTTNSAVAALVRHVGFDAGRTAAVAKKLTEAGVIPSGAPGRSPVLDYEHVLDILIGTAVDTPLRAVATAVRTYRALTPGGANLEGAPASVTTAGTALDIFAEWAIRGEFDLLRRDQIECVSSWPEISIHRPTAVSRFVAPGSLATVWQENGHRKSTTINGSALVDCLRSLFAEEK